MLIEIVETMCKLETDGMIDSHHVHERVILYSLPYFNPVLLHNYQDNCYSLEYQISRINFCEETFFSKEKTEKRRLGIVLCIFTTPKKQEI